MSYGSTVSFSFSTTAGIQGFYKIRGRNKAAHNGMERGQPAWSSVPKLISRKCARERQA